MIVSYCTYVVIILDEGSCTKSFMQSEYCHCSLAGTHIKMKSKYVFIISRRNILSHLVIILPIDRKIFKIHKSDNNDIDKHIPYCEE